MHSNVFEWILNAFECIRQRLFSLLPSRDSYVGKSQPGQYDYASETPFVLLKQEKPGWKQSWSRRKKQFFRMRSNIFRMHSKLFRMRSTLLTFFPPIYSNQGLNHLILWPGVSSASFWEAVSPQDKAIRPSLVQVFLFFCWL